jgi:hypothetical protein
MMNCATVKKLPANKGLDGAFFGECFFQTEIILKRKCVNIASIADDADIIFQDVCTM